MADFSLLDYVGVQGVATPKTEAQLQREKLQFDEMQFQSHRLQEAKRKAREDKLNHGAQTPRGTMKYAKDHHHHYGLLWFSEGKLGEAASEVGKPTKQGANTSGSRSVDMTFQNSASSPSTAPFPQGEGRSGQAEPTTQAPPSARPTPLRQFQPLRLREAPPHPLDVAERVLIRAERGELPIEGGLVGANFSNATSATSPSGYVIRLPHEMSQSKSSATPNRSHRQPSPRPAPAMTSYDPSTNTSAGMTRQAQDMIRQSKGLAPFPEEDAPKKGRVTTAPYAEHYGENLIYDEPQPPYNHFDRDGVPRGRYGVDHQEGQARQAQRLADSMRQESSVVQKRSRQSELKHQLDELCKIKRQQKLEEREIENRAVYGYSLPMNSKDLRGAEKDHRKQLEAAWQTQARDARDRKAAEDAYYAPAEEDWAAVSTLIERSEKNAETAPSNTQQSAWLKAWQEHQANEGAVRKAAAERKIREEQAKLGPNVLNYSDRILEAERQKKIAQQQYQAALDQQVRDQRFDKKAQFAYHMEREKMYAGGQY